MKLYIGTELRRHLMRSRNEPSPFTVVGSGKLMITARFEGADFMSV